LVGTTLVLACAKFITKLTFELQMSAFLDVLDIHALEHSLIFVLIELGYKKLSDRLESLGLEFLARYDEFVMVVYMKQHVKPLKR
jgi:hypothetical protein